MSKIAVILALPEEYNTSSMIRCRSLIEAIAALGHDVKCYMPFADYNSKYYSKYSGIRGVKIYRYGKIRQLEDIKNINNSRRRSIKSICKTIAYCIFKKYDVFGSTLLFLPERKRISDDIRSEKFDILMTFSDPMPAHMIGKYCKQHNKHLYYIQQWGDPLATDTIAKIAQPVWFRKIVEKSLIREADRICYVSPFTADEQKKLYPQFSKNMMFLPTPSVRYPNKKSEETPKGRIRIGYYGSYTSLARNLVPFYNAAVKTKDIDFYIVGDSDIELMNTDNVRVIPRVSEQQLNNYIEKTDVVVCLMNLKGNQIPGKVYHDASLSKDILFIKDGEFGNSIEQYFSKYNHYTFVRNDEHEIEKAFCDYIKKGVPHREPVTEFYADNIAKKLIEIN